MIIIYTWAVMLLVGDAHHADPRIPALGYAATFCLTAAGYLVSFFGAHAARGGK